MSKVLIESQYFPTIGFYSLLYHSESFIIDRHENYHKGSYRNRCEILSSQGKVTLSIPLKSGKNNQQGITDVLIDNDKQWAINHLRSIESCYGKSPYFEYYHHHIATILTEKHTYLFDLNWKLIQKFAEILHLDTKLRQSDMFYSESTEQVDVKRDYISPKTKNKYRLASTFNFEAYDQVFSDEQLFAANLSILDLIFCQGPESIWYLSKIRKK